MTLPLVSCPEPSTVNGPQMGNLSCEAQAENSGLLSGVCLVSVHVCAHSRKMGFATTWILVARISVITVVYFHHYFWWKILLGGLEMQIHSLWYWRIHLDGDVGSGARLQPGTWPALYEVATAAPPPEASPCEGTSRRRLCNWWAAPRLCALQAWLQPLPTAFLSSKALG